MTNQTNHRAAERPILRLLRHKHSQDYFTGEGWTRNIEEARSYADSLEAAQTCARSRLENVEIVLRVTGGTSDLFCTELWPERRDTVSSVLA